VFRAHYNPGEGLSLVEWRERLPGAVLIINANFYTPQETVLGLLVSDGQVYGRAYTDRGGTFVVENGVPRVRSSINEPYQGEPLQQAVQGFPMLVQNGTRAYTDPAQTRSARRTLIGQDAQGRIVIMITPLAGMGLTPMSAYLAGLDDLNLTQAFNLDGGGSVMMYLAPQDYALPSLDAVPAVLAVYPR
jgi:exopolysaccharide biosynthesis protein